MAADGLREFMDARDYQYVDLGSDCYLLHFTGKHGEYKMFARAGEDPGQVVVFTCCPVKVPEDRGPGCRLHQSCQLPPDDRLARNEPF
jgi:hypothetical protein